jgi:Flp pilus assembly pilin Flp
MKKIFAFIKARLKTLSLCKTGATAVEFGVIAALISVAAMQGLRATGHRLICIYDGVAQTLEAPGASFGCSTGG